MAKILVLYYSTYGHMEIMANAAADGVREAGHEAVVKRVAELVPEAVAKAGYFKLDQAAPIITDPNELAEYDGFIFGMPTRFGGVPSQMKNFLDQTGGLWAKGALINKVASVMVSTASQHGGQETTIIGAQLFLQHHGMIVVPLSYGFQGQLGHEKVVGGSPYGMTLVTGGQGERMPDENDLAGAKYQGKRTAEITAKIIA
jgi:NAD(P)H dehydrogenase (quinone)